MVVASCRTTKLHIGLLDGPIATRMGPISSHTNSFAIKDFAGRDRTLRTTAVRQLAQPLQSKSSDSREAWRPSLPPLGWITSLARGASNECDIAVALPLTAVSSQNVIGSFEARFFLRAARTSSEAGAQCDAWRTREFGASSANSLSPQVRR